MPSSPHANALISRFRGLCFVALLASSLIPKSIVAEDFSAIGLVQTRPSSGNFVETDQGYMIAYSETIPGSEVTFEMVPISGGMFLLGSPADDPDRQEDEGPQVEVSVPAMWVGKYEVTWSEYKLYMELCNIFEQFNDQGVRQIVEQNQIDAITAPSKLYEPGFTFAAGEGPRRPAVSMSQYAAKQYTKWLSLLTNKFYRLPTEAEWEYACRAGTKTAYSFGADLSAIDDYAWHYENSDDQTHPVGEKQPNAWGLFDMHGNASEWVLDFYDVEWYAKLAEKAAPVSAAEAYYEKKTLFPRVLRGGSWNLDPIDCRTSLRRKSHDDDWRSYDPNTPKSPWWFASDEAQDVGFRIIRPLKPVPRKEREQFWESNVELVLRTANHRIDNEGRGKRGVVDSGLPAATKALQSK